METKQEAYFGAKTFQTMRCLLRMAAAHTEEKTCAHTHTQISWPGVRVRSLTVVPELPEQTGIVPTAAGGRS